MKTIDIYGTDSCKWCASAVALVSKHNYPFRYFNLTRAPSLHEEFNSRSGNATTVPQIFVGDKHIGGYTDLALAENDGSLQQMIGE